MKMPMIEKIYRKIFWLITKPQERGEYSAGYWMGLVREEALKMSAAYTGRFLEVGCGEGLFLTELASSKRHLELYGVDSWGRILQRARERLAEKDLAGIELYKANATELPFQDGFFDAVVCINVIFNLPSKEMLKKVIQEISRVCKKGGRVLIDFRNSNNPLLYFKYKFAPWYDSTVKEHPLKTYKLKEIKFILEQEGLQVIKRTTVGFPAGNFAPIIILEMEKR